MITLLYNTIEQVTGSMREGRYTDRYGQTGVYPSKYVELIVYDPPDPTHDPSIEKVQAGDYYPDVPNLLWTRDKTIANKTAEEIAEYEDQQKENVFQSGISAGYTNADSITVSITDSSRIMWNQLLVLLDSKLSNGEYQQDTNVSFLDINRSIHQMPVSGVKKLISDLGTHYYDLWLTRNS
jgi:hypothetical protein